MLEGFRLIPEQASTMAAKVDLLFWVLVAVTVFFTGLIFTLLTVFAIRYRRRTTVDQPSQPPSHFSGVAE